MSFGAVMLAIAVSAGAFGSHVLDSFAPRSLLPIWHTAVLYQLIHGAGILGIAVGRKYILERWQNLGFSALFIVSILFSGILYLFVFTQQGWLTTLTPVGGVLMVLGWILIAVGAVQQGRQSNT